MPGVEQASLEEEFMLAIQSGEVEMETLMVIGKALSNQHVNGIVGYLLCQLIKANKKLQHVDLQNTNLPAWVIANLAQKLRKSRSLLSLHLSDNVGLGARGLKDKVFKTLRCKELESKNHVHLGDVEHKAFREPSFRRLKTQLSTQSFKLGEERNMASDAIQVKQILQQKRIESRVTEFPRNDDANEMILTRHIGLKEAMPGSG